MGISNISYICKILRWIFTYKYRITQYYLKCSVSSSLRLKTANSSDWKCFAVCGWCICGTWLEFVVPACNSTLVTPFASSLDGGSPLFIKGHCLKKSDCYRPARQTPATDRPSLHGAWFGRLAMKISPPLPCLSIIPSGKRRKQNTSNRFKSLKFTITGWRVESSPLIVKRTLFAKAWLLQAGTPNSSRGSVELTLLDLTIFFGGVALQFLDGFQTREKKHLVLSLLDGLETKQ